MKNKVILTLTLLTTGLTTGCAQACFPMGSFLNTAAASPSQVHESIAKKYFEIQENEAVKKALSELQSAFGNCCLVYFTELNKTLTDDERKIVADFLDAVFNCSEMFKNNIKLLLEAPKAQEKAMQEPTPSNLKIAQELQNQALTIAIPPMMELVGKCLEFGPSFKVVASGTVDKLLTQEYMQKYDSFLNELAAIRDIFKKEEVTETEDEAAVEESIDS